MDVPRLHSIRALLWPNAGQASASLQVLRGLVCSAVTSGAYAGCIDSQSWNLGVNPGSVKALPPEATTSTYCMGGSRPWALRQVLAVEIKLDAAGYVAGVKTRAK